MGCLQELDSKQIQKRIKIRLRRKDAFERVYMDVSKKVFLLALSLVLISCDDGPQAEGPSPFIKTSVPGCEGQRRKGEYLVFWKNGKVSVEKYVNDKSFVEDFVEKHKDEVITSEPHYQIQVEASSKISQRDWGGYLNWGVDVIGAADLWSKATNAEEVIVAVIDSGVDVGHPELQGSFAINNDETVNGVDDDGNGLIDDRMGYDFVVGSGEVVDYTGHGTHVSGVIGAQHGVGKVTGVAPNVKILPLAFISNNGGGSVEAAVNAIRYAASRKVKVINASWGGSTCSSLLKNEIAALAKQNILFVTAAGNSNNNLSQIPEYPAAFILNNMITVGASAYEELTNSEVTAGFSNFGELVDLVAPGANIASTYPPEFDSDGLLDGVVVLEGTSMATPYVAASAALLWSIKPAASFVEIKQALLAGAKPGPFRVKTRGSLFLPQALAELESMLP